MSLARLFRMRGGAATIAQGAHFGDEVIPWLARPDPATLRRL